VSNEIKSVRHEGFIEFLGAVVTRNQHDSIS